MSSLNIALNISSPEDDTFPLQLANFAPLVQVVTVHDDKVERSMTLNDSAWKEVDSYELTPVLWVAWNIGQASDSTDNPLLLDFGGGDEPMTLPVGRGHFWWGTKNPKAQAVTGASRLYYAVFQAP